MTDDFSLPSHLRVGWADYGRPCDAVVKRAFEMLPGATLPPRWSYKNLDHFLEKYGHMGRVLWSKTASYHLLMLNGFHIIRIWTDSPKTCIIDVSDVVAANFYKHFGGGNGGASNWIQDVPKSCTRKCAPLTKRVRGVNDSMIQSLMYVIRDTYGIKVGD